MKRKAITACLLALPLAVTAAPPSKDGGGPSEVQVVNDATAPIPVEVTSMPAPSGTADVNVVNGSLNVNVNDSTPIQVQVTNQPSGTSNVNVVGTADVNVVGGTVSVDDSAPIQVEVTNPLIGGGCASSDYVYVGISDDYAPLYSGPKPVMEACRTKFGPDARLAKTREIENRYLFLDDEPTPTFALVQANENQAPCNIFRDDGSTTHPSFIEVTEMRDINYWFYFSGPLTVEDMPECSQLMRVACSVPVCPPPE